MISKTLKVAAKLYGPDLVFTAKNVPACSIHAVGEMELLFSIIDSNIIKLIYCRQRYEMLYYLHV